MEKTPVVDTRWLRGRVSGWQRSFFSRRLIKSFCTTFVLLLTFRFLWSHSSQHYLHVVPPNDFYLQRGSFQSLPLSGHTNTATTERVQCNDLRYDGEIQVQESFHLSDNMVEIAAELDDHPMIDYSEQDPRWSVEERVNHTWARLSGSSIWLEQHNVFLAVTRVMFYDKGIKHWPIISFLRGQVYDQDWNELKNHVIEWQGKKITFPTTFRVPTPFEAGGCFYGPEDPRIIIEEGVEGAEPVVIYNMVSDTKELIRTMHIFRPFSNRSTILTINGQKVRAQAEKNWAPFFYNSEPQTTDHQKRPNDHLHFIHLFKPLRILKCNLDDGLCDWAYEQSVSLDEGTRHNDSLGRMSGGTNFVQIPMKSAPGTSAYVGFPRTHIKAGCLNEAMYRPEMMVMTASNGSHFHLDFLSDSIDFGSAVLDPQARSDPCGEGRILIANSVARWDRSDKQDVMTISLSVADSTVQALRIHGILAYVKRLPHLVRSLGYQVGEGGEAAWNEEWSRVGLDVLGCTVEAAQNYSNAVAEVVHGKDLASILEALEDSSNFNSEYMPDQGVNG